MFSSYPYCVKGEGKRTRARGRGPEGEGKRARARGQGGERARGQERKTILGVLSLIQAVPFHLTAAATVIRRGGIIDTCTPPPSLFPIHPYHTMSYHAMPPRDQSPIPRVRPRHRPHHQACGHGATQTQHRQLSNRQNLATSFDHIAFCQCLRALRW